MTWVHTRMLVIYWLHGNIYCLHGDTSQILCFVRRKKAGAIQFINIWQILTDCCWLQLLKTRKFGKQHSWDIGIWIHSALPCLDLKNHFFAKAVSVLIDKNSWARKVLCWQTNSKALLKKKLKYLLCKD